MVSHIYGRLNLIQNPESRPHMFIKEFKMYISHFEKEIQNRLPKLDNKYRDYLINLKVILKMDSNIIKI